MPSLFRFLFVIGLIAAVVTGSFYVLGEFFEPKSQEVNHVVPGIKIRRQ